MQGKTSGKPDQKVIAEPFFLGRPASGNRTGLSFAACFSGLAVLILIPYAIYKYGAGFFWCALGLFAGMTVVWKVLPYRMYRYSRKGERIRSFSDYVRIRFGKGSRVLSLVAAAAFTLFTLFFSVQLFRLGRDLFEAFFRRDDLWWIRVVSIFLLLPIIILGFSLITGMGRPTAILILFALALPVIAIFKQMGGSGIVRYTMMSGVPNTVSDYMNLLHYDGEPLTVATGISLFVAGFLFAGLPVSFPFFAVLRHTRQVKRARHAVFAWTLPVFVLSCFLGGISRAYLYLEGEVNSPAAYAAALFRSLRRGKLLAGTAAVIYAAALVAAFLLLLYFSFHRMITEMTSIISWMDEKAPRKLGMGIAVSWALLVLAEFRMPELSWESVFFVIDFWACSAGPVMFSSIAIRKLSTAAVTAGVLLGSLGMVLPELLPEAIFGSKLTFFFGPEGAGSEIFSLTLSFLGIILFTRLFPEKDKDVLTRFDEVKNRIG